MVSVIAGKLLMLSILVVAASTTFAEQGAAEKTKPKLTPKELRLDLDNKITLGLVEIPAGKFLMGSPEKAWDHQQDEVQHEVTISRPFYMGTTDVTVDQYAQFSKASGYKTEAEKDGYSYSEQINDGSFRFVKVNGLFWNNPGFEQKGDYPVVHITWNDAQAFCMWLSKKSGKNVTLPTEAQWEYACRAGTTTVFPWGDQPDAGKGWANGADQSLKQKLFRWKNADFFNWDDGFVYTSPVGRFKPNALGLYDMIGDVRQWCQDRYADFTNQSAADPLGPAAGKDRVQRGGSWHGFTYACRSASRLAYQANFRDDACGFRVVALSEPAPLNDKSP